VNIGEIKSVGGVTIRLTDERWEHIIESHPGMSGFFQTILDTVEYPEFVTRGQKGVKIAIVNLGRKRWLHVMYKEIAQVDGFIITAFFDDEYNKSRVIWSRHN
jgi:hypothetical protein